MFPLWHSDGEFSVIDDVIDDDTDDVTGDVSGDVTDSNDQAAHNDLKDKNDRNDNSNDQKDNSNDQKDDNGNKSNASGQGGQGGLNLDAVGTASANGNGNIKQEQVSWWGATKMAHLVYTSDRL